MHFWNNEDRFWPGLICFGSAVMSLLGAMASMDMLWSPLSSLFPLGILGWLCGSILALCQRRYGWVIASLPIMAIPISFFGLLFWACSRGDCL